ncbi:MAG: HEAT repeat domain-containing protein, partial [Vicinamibacteria bacterium]
SEVFLNLDPIGGYGEFSMKDSVYGGGVLRELGRLLQGEVSATARETAVLERPAPGVAGSLASDTPAPSPNPDVSRIASLLEKAGAGVPQPERRKALETLAKMGPRARDAMPVFLEALADDDPIIRGEALLGLPKLRPDPQIGAAAVTPLLRDSYPVNQVWAANALADFGQSSAAATYLTVFLKGEAKTWAAGGLTRLGPEAKGAVPLLTEMLEERKDAHEAYAACMALAAIGREARSALPTLEAASRDPDKYIRDAASYAIREIDGR